MGVHEIGSCNSNGTRISELDVVGSLFCFELTLNADLCLAKSISLYGMSAKGDR